MIKIRIEADVPRIVEYSRSTGVSLKGPDQGWLAPYDPDNTLPDSEPAAQLTD